jgi:hypothetical protein
MVDHRKDSRVGQSRVVLREAQLAREGRVDTQHAPFAEHTLRVPTSHWHALARLFPGLNSKDHAEYEEAMKRLHESPLADPYRVRTRKAQLGHL